VTPRLSPGRWDPDVRQRLVELIAARGQASSSNLAPIATFDWDNTCIRGDIGEAALRRLEHDGNPGVYERYERLCREHGDAVGYRYCAEVIGGRDELAMRQWTLSIIDDALRSGEIVEREEIRELFWVLERHGWQVWVVSASATPLVEAFGQRYGVPASRVIGMDLRRDAAGHVHPEVVGPVTYRGGKVEAIDARIGRRPDLAVGDAPTDLEMLASARHALVIDRGHALLRAEATRNGWWTQPAF
jgi:HAD superfamily phosphoserine phosphatase-like hydrolase